LAERAQTAEPPPTTEQATLWEAPAATAEAAPVLVVVRVLVGTLTRGGRATLLVATAGMVEAERTPEATVGTVVLRSFMGLGRLLLVLVETAAMLSPGRGVKAVGAGAPTPIPRPRLMLWAGPVGEAVQVAACLSGFLTAILIPTFRVVVVAVGVTPVVGVLGMRLVVQVASVVTELLVEMAGLVGMRPRQVLEALSVL
jgi:hypothetical protein